MALIKVLKWEVPNVGDVFSVPGIRVVLFGPQENIFSGSLYVWTECYGGVDEEEHIKLDLVVYPTGQEFRDNHRSHIMSCKDGVFIWHLYQDIKGDMILGQCQEREYGVNGVRRCLFAAHHPDPHNWGPWE